MQDQKERAQLLTPPTQQPPITPATPLTLPTPLPAIIPMTEITLQSYSTSDSPTVDLDPYQMFVQAGSQLWNTMAETRAHYEAMQKKIDGQKIDMEERRRKLAEDEEYYYEDYSDDEDEFEQLQSENGNLRK